MKVAAGDAAARTQPGSGKTVDSLRHSRAREEPSESARRQPRRVWARARGTLGTAPGASSRLPLLEAFAGLLAVAGLTAALGGLVITLMTAPSGSGLTGTPAATQEEPAALGILVWLELGAAVAMVGMAIGFRRHMAWAREILLIFLALSCVNRLCDTLALQRAAHWFPVARGVLRMTCGLLILLLVMRTLGIGSVMYPMERRAQAEKLPEDYGVPYQEVAVTTADGLRLVGWYIPSVTGAVIIAQHGYHGSRGNMLYDALMLHRHGYGVLVSTFRAHDRSEGELITWGKLEVRDFEAWYQYLRARSDVDSSRIGILGESMGGLVAIQYAAGNPGVRALAVHSPLVSMRDTVPKGVTRTTGLPALPFAPMIRLWAERTAGVRARDIDATRWIGQISPRPVLIMMGGADPYTSAESAQRLFEAAGEPKELWLEGAAGHHGLPEVAPEEYERRVVAFFDRYLLGK